MGKAVRCCSRLVGAIPLTLVGFVVAAVAVGLLELCGCGSGGTLGRIGFTVLACCFFAWNASRFTWIVYTYYNDNPGDDARVSIVKAFDYFVSYVFGTALLFMLTWIWGREAYWSGVPEFVDNDYGDLGFYRVYVVFFYTASMIYNGGGVSRYLPNHWVTELVFSGVMLMNTIITIVVLSVSVTIAINAINKRASSVPAFEGVRVEGRNRPLHPLPVAAPKQLKRPVPSRQPPYTHGNGGANPAYGGFVRSVPSSPQATYGQY